MYHNTYTYTHTHTQHEASPLCTITTSRHKRCFRGCLRGFIGRRTRGRRTIQVSAGCVPPKPTGPTEWPLYTRANAMHALMHVESPATDAEGWGAPYIGGHMGRRVPHPAAPGKAIDGHHLPCAPVVVALLRRTRPVNGAGKLCEPSTAARAQLPTTRCKCGSTHPDASSAPVRTTSSPPCRHLPLRSSLRF